MRFINIFLASSIVEFDEAEAILQQNLSRNPAVYGKMLAECKEARKK